MKTASSTVSVTVTGDGLNLTESDTNTNSASATAPTSATLANGFNTVSVPAGVIGVLIKPPPTSAIALTLKGITGDTGVPISPSTPTYLALPAGTGSFGVTANGVVTLLLAWC